MRPQVFAQRHGAVVLLFARAEQQRVAALRRHRLAQRGAAVRVGVELGEVALAEAVQLRRYVPEPPTQSVAWQIGTTAGRERGWQSLYISVLTEQITKNNKT